MVEALDLESLELSAETFVDDAFKQYIADIVFICKTRDGRHGSVYILSNTNRSPEPVCALQILKYMVGIWTRFFEKWIIWKNKMPSLCDSDCVLSWETEMERETDAGSVWG